MQELYQEDEDLDDWYNSSVTELNTSASSLEDSLRLQEKIQDIRKEVER